MTKVEYFCDVSYWQHNTGNGECGNRCIHEPFSNFKDAQRFYENISRLLAMGECSPEKDHLSNVLEDRLALWMVTFKAVRIFKRTTTTIVQDIPDPSKYVE